MERKINIPINGQEIILYSGKLNVPDNPIIPFIEGDGIGVDISPVMIKVVDSAVLYAYQGKRKISWMEIYAGEKSIKKYGHNSWLPQETVDLIKKYKIAIKGPLTTPVGDGIRSLNVLLRQLLDLYICLRPIRYFNGVPSPLKYPEKTNIIVFRENLEDVYSGIEWKAASYKANKLIKFLQKDMNVNTIRFPYQCGIGIKTCSEEGSKRLIRAAINFAIDNNRNVVTLVHKGNIMKFTEGAFKTWGFQVALEEFGGKTLNESNKIVIKRIGNKKDLIINDVIADAFLQKVLLNPENYDVIACMNLNGDYISDALAAQVGGIGISPGANIGENCVLFEATHGTAPKYAGQDIVNPSSIILSAEMMLRYLKWNEAADLIIKSIEYTISKRTVTYDFHRLLNNATLLKCSEFGKEIIKNMNLFVVS